MAFNISETLILTGNSYISSLNNAVSDNSNINLNGYTLYIGETALTSTDYKGESNSQNSKTTNANNTESSKKDNTVTIRNAVITVAVATVVMIGGVVFIVNKRNRK